MQVGKKRSFVLFLILGMLFSLQVALGILQLFRGAPANHPFPSMFIVGHVWSIVQVFIHSCAVIPARYGSLRVRRIAVFLLSPVLVGLLP